MAPLHTFASESTAKEIFIQGTEMAASLWRTVSYPTALLEVSSALILISFLWVWTLHLKVKRQNRTNRQAIEDTSQEALRWGYLEAQRSRILEAINSPMPLDEVLALIKDFLEEQLPGCVCAIHLDLYEEDISTVRREDADCKLQRLIVGGSGEKLGVMSLRATEELLATEAAKESLDISCNLAALTIENRRLFGDLVYRSRYDQLTGIPNRYLLERRLQEAIEQARVSGKRVGLIYIDLDFFKLVNDQHGHRTGDIYLQTIAQRLLQRLRTGDTIGRVGGDEFIVVLANIDNLSQLQQAAYRLHEVFDEPFVVDSVSISGSASFGISSFPEDGETMDALKRKADISMYQIKKSHHALSAPNGSVVFSPKDLERALRQNRFLLYYQPQYSQDGKIGGVEALVRMKNEEGEIVPPGEFISIAEKSGLILSIGDWILRSACQQLAIWHKTVTPKLTMVVNVSGLQLQSENYSSAVIDILNDTGIPPSSLELEITETILLENLSLCMKHIQQLRELGVRFSIDDFGTGYSSLSMVHQLPIDTIKIDRAFIQALHQKPSSQPVIQLILSLAKDLGIRVIAEGVENKDEVEKMMAVGCRYFQGFYFSLPRPAIDIEELLAAQKPLSASLNQFDSPPLATSC